MIAAATPVVHVDQCVCQCVQDYKTAWENGGTGPQPAQRPPEKVTNLEFRHFGPYSERSVPWRLTTACWQNGHARSTVDLPSLAFLARKVGELWTGKHRVRTQRENDTKSANFADAYLRTLKLEPKFSTAFTYYGSGVGQRPRATSITPNVCPDNDFLTK